MLLQLCCEGLVLGGIFLLVSYFNSLCYVVLLHVTICVQLAVQVKQPEMAYTLQQELSTDHILAGPGNV